MLKIIIPENYFSQSQARLLNWDSVMISDEIIDSFVSLLKISSKNKISISLESLYHFTEY